MKRLLLFDIDGTLIDGGRIGSRAISRMFLEEFGIADATDGFFFDGKIDPIIFHELGERHELDVAAEGYLERMHDLYLERLEAERQLPQRGRVLGGVLELLTALEAADEHTLALLTGNLKRGAEIKLACFGLDGRFAFGAFGDDGPTRESLVSVALRRAETHAGRRFEASQTVVIGDSVRDIRCARANGARVVAVATGNTPFDELERHAPDLLLEDLENTEAFLAALARL